MKRSTYAKIALIALSIPWTWAMSHYRVAIIDKASVAESIKWETDEEIAVVLETVNNKKIGLAHWSEDLDAAVPFFFEPDSIDYVSSCHPELLEGEIRQKHLFRNHQGVTYYGRVGQLVVFSSGVL